MMDGATVILCGDTQRAYAKRLMDEAPAGYVVKIKAPTRSDLQNRRLWAMLEDVAAHVVWHGVKLSREEWKDVFTAALKRAKVVPGLDGGFVVVGQSTSRMSKAEFGELMDLIEAFGAQHDVTFREPEGERAA